MVTMQDVAKAAGVSTMTVSNVLNNYPHIRDETRDRVLRAIDELGYRVNVAARNLRAGRTNTIGFAVPEVDRPYFGQLASRIIAKAAAAGYRVVIEQTGADRENELSAIVSSRNRMYDALILSAVGLGTGDRELLRVDFPMVILGETVFEGPVDHIALPNVEGTFAATRHLIAQGSRRIAIVEGEDSSAPNVSSLRHGGYLRALQTSDVDFDPALSIGIPELTLAEGRKAAERLADSQVSFDGIVCVTDTVALGVMRGLADRGIRVPEDVRVIGFDGIEEGEYSIPRLSTVAPDHDEVAALAIDLVLRRIAGNGEWEPREFVSSFRVVARESTA